MNLVDILRIRLNTLCHACEELVDLLDDVDEALLVSSGSIRNLYDLSKQCIDRAFKEFCLVKPVPKSCDEACHLLLGKLDAGLAFAYSQSRAIKRIFVNYKNKVKTKPVVADNPLELYLYTGDVLTRQLLNSHQASSTGELPSRKIKVEVEQATEEGFAVLANKAGGESKITFRFCPPEFTFGSFMRLPFRFFHECYSHIYTAPLFAETLRAEGQPGIFEEGWLLYAAQLEYEHRLAEQNSHDMRVEWALRMPHHRIEYLKLHLAQLMTNPRTSRNKSEGYRLAHWYYQTFCSRDLSLFFTTTHLLYGCPWNRYESEFYDVHQCFVSLTRKLRKRWNSLARAGRETVKNELKGVVDAGDVAEVLRLLRRAGS